MALHEQTLPIIIVKTVFVSLFTILSIVENFCVLYAIKKFKTLQTVPNYFIASLSLADFLYAIFGSTSIIATTLSKEWVLGGFYCNFIGVTNTLFLTASITTLVAISVNRYIAVSRPFRVITIYTHKNTLIIIVMIWFLSLLFSAPPLFGWSNFEPGSNFCTFNTRKHPSYIIMLATTHYISPAILQPICYYKIYKVLKMRHKIFSTDLDRSLENKSKIHRTPVKELNESPIKKKQGDVYGRVQKNCKSVQKHTVTDSDNSHENQNENEDLKKVKVISSNSIELSNDAKRPGITQNRSEKIELYRILKHEAKTTAIMVGVVIAFYVCWTPLAIASILFAFDLQPSEFGLVTFAIVITCTNGVINPIIYGIMNKPFRKAYKTILRRQRLKLRLRLN